MLFISFIIAPAKWWSRTELCGEMQFIAQISLQTKKQTNRQTSTHVNSKTYTQIDFHYVKKIIIISEHTQNEYKRHWYQRTIWVSVFRTRYLESERNFLLYVHLFKIQCQDFSCYKRDDWTFSVAASLGRLMTWTFLDPKTAFAKKMQLI